MRITTSLLPAFHRGVSSAEVAVVIDVLRATSVIVSALDAGAKEIITCREVDEARRLADAVSPRPLLCGERGCRPIEGFDLGNSPAEYDSARVGGQRLVLTTTNGTAAIEAASETPKLVIASFLNLSAVVAELRSAESVHLVCSGTEGQVTAEDVLLAGAIVSRCEELGRVTQRCDASMLAGQLWQSWFGSVELPDAQVLGQRLRTTQGGRNLIRVGYQADLERCAVIDTIATVPHRIAQTPTRFALASKPNPA